MSDGEHDRCGPMGLERGLDLLELISGQRDPQRFSDLVRDLGAGKAVTSRLLKALVARELVVKDEASGRYSRGPGLVRLAQGMDWAPHTRKAVAHAANAIIETLCRRFEHTVMVTHWNGKALECVASSTAEEGLAPWPIGVKKDQLHRGPWGWVVLSEQQIFDRDKVAQDVKFAAKVDVAAGIAAFQAKGWAELSFPHCIRIAAPLFCQGDRLVGSLGLFINPLAMVEHTLDDLAAALCESAREISVRLGAQKLPEGVAV